MELVALFIKHGDRFTLRNFMIFYIVKIYLESLYDLRAIFGLQPVPNLLETGAKLGELHIMVLQVCFGRPFQRANGQLIKNL